MRRRDFIKAIIVSIAWPLAAQAQRGAAVRRIGFLGAASLNAYAQRVQAFQAGLRELGYVDGKNVEITFRWAEGNYTRLPELAAELLSLPVDVLITHGTPGTLAAKRATTTTPIVMAVSGDAVATGIVSSLSHPGGNITGSTFFNPELIAKRLELAKEAIPSSLKIGFLFNANNLSDNLLLKTAEKAGQSLNLEITSLPIRSSDDIAATLSTMRNRVDAVIVSDDGLFVSNAQVIAYISREKKLPLFGFTELTHAGGLIGYSADLVELFRRAAVFVDKILKGTKPADIPVEQPTKFELVINLKTARTVGVQVSGTLLARADEVIE